MPEYYEVTILFSAEDEEHAERLFEMMLEGIGCGDKCEEEGCPHFCGGTGPRHIEEEDD